MSTSPDLLRSALGAVTHTSPTKRNHHDPHDAQQPPPQVRKDEGGFTLIELLIVIVVLGILAGIVVFGVGTFRQDARPRRSKADCKTVSVAAEAFNAKNG